MPTKNTSKKSKAAKKTSKKSHSSRSQQEATAELKPNELKISFDHPDQILPKLMELAQHFAGAPADLLLQPTAPAVAADVLGGARARLIVSSCAQSTAWTATLNDLGLSPLIFRNCVAAGVSNAGYVPPPISATPDTRLIDVVAAIQGAPRQ